MGIVIKKLNKKRIAFFLVLLVLGTFLFGQINLAAAQANNSSQANSNNTATVSVGSSADSDETAQWLAKALTWITLGFINLVGKITTVFIEQLMGIAGFNDFVNAYAVQIGWKLVRDLSNIFLVILMLLIAIGTLFNVQTYEYKRLLPKLMLAAILINFSKTIVGMAIDFGQVIMLTFVKAFNGLNGANGAAAIINGLGVHSMTQLADVIEGQGGDVLRWNIFGATFLALIMLIIASIVILALTVVLLFRILMLWILIIFSPLAFVASAMGGGPLKSVSFVGNYWSNLSKYIAIGPILAFFLWLSFNIMMVKDTQNKKHIIELYRASEQNESSPGHIEYLASKISSPQNMFDYMVVIALLIGSLMVSQQMGVMAGAMGMNILNKAQNKVKQKTSEWSRASTIGVTKKAALQGGKSFDRAFIKWQKNKGVKNPLSLRPSMIKQAWKEHTAMKEQAIYGREGVAGGMVDKFNSLLGGPKTDKGEQEKEAYEAKRRSELVRGDEYQDPKFLISRAQKLIRTPEAKTYDGRIELKAIFDNLAKSNSLGSFLKARGKADTASNLKSELKAVFGEQEGAKVMNRMEKIAEAKGNLKYSGSTNIDLASGQVKFLDLEKADNNDEYLRKRFAVYSWAAEEKQRRGEKLTPVEAEFLRVKQIGGDLTQLSGEAREQMITEKQAKIVEKKVAGKSPTEQARSIRPDALSPDGRGEESGLSPIGRAVLAGAAGGANLKFSNVSTAARNFIRQPGTLDEIKKILEDPNSGLTKEQKQDIEEFIKKLKIPVEVDAQAEINNLRSEAKKLEDEARVAEDKKDSLAKQGKVDTPEYNQFKQTAEEKHQAAKSKQQRADELEREMVINSLQEQLQQVKPEQFNDPKLVAQASEQMAQTIEQALQEIENSVKTGAKIDTGRISQMVEKSMQDLQKTIDKNIKPGQPKPDLANQRLTNMMRGLSKATSETQKGFLKQLKGLAVALADLTGSDVQA